MYQRSLSEKRDKEKRKGNVCISSQSVAHWHFLFENGRHWSVSWVQGSVELPRLPSHLFLFFLETSWTVEIVCWRGCDHLWVSRPCSDLVMSHVVGEAVLIEVSAVTFLLRQNANLSASGTSRLTACFCNSSQQPSHFVVDTHMPCAPLRSAPWVTRTMTLVLGCFSHCFLHWMDAFAKTAGLVFSSECGRRAICVTLESTLRHQTLLFCRINSCFCCMKNLTTSRVLFSNIVFLNCCQRWMSEVI